MNPLHPQPTSYDYPESKSFEGIYQHICIHCSHLFFGFKGRGPACYKCQTKYFPELDKNDGYLRS